MIVIVTGCAGFIGSHLAEHLVKKGYEVIGIDCFTDYYPRAIKEKNIEWLRTRPNFILSESDLTTTDFDKIYRLSNPNDQLVIFHLAAQPNVRLSWGKNFEIYTRNNIRATQRLLEWAKDQNVKKFICASSSSVYGNTDYLPMREDAVCKPISPYGVTKLACEYLCHSYFANYKLPITILRYFTVYGPRQRPDMAFHKFIKAMLEDRDLEIHGDGNQTRDFTYIDDAVKATISAIDSPASETFNVGSGTTVTLKEVTEVLQKITNKEIKLKYTPVQKGDVKHTAADITKARKFLKYEPKIELQSGLTKEVEWIKSHMLE